MNPIRRAWRAMWFKDDDDKTPQGKLGRGCFYIFYMIMFFILMSGFVVPGIIWVVGETVEHFMP